MRTLLKTYGAVPASVRGGNGDAYNERNAYAADPGGSDTGMGASVERWGAPAPGRGGAWAPQWSPPRRD